jgi:hypothetical protein
MQGLNTRLQGMCDTIQVVCSHSVVLKMRMREVGLRREGQNNAKAGPKRADGACDWPDRVAGGATSGWASPGAEKRC